MTVLHYAVENNLIDAVNVLLKHPKIDVNIKTILNQKNLIQFKQ